MNLQALIKDYARLTVRTGANVAPGQLVGIMGHVEHVDFVRALAEECYEAGARYVDVWYWDAHLKRSRVNHAPEDSLGWVPPWLEERYEKLTAEKGASIALTGDPDPNLLVGVDPKRAGRDRMPLLASRLQMVHSEQVNWTIVSCPTEGWAEAVYGEPDVERLWSDVASFMRLDTNDPVQAWDEHLKNLRARAADMTERGFDQLHFEGPGTDLKVGLIPGHRWLAAGFTTRWGRAHVPNMPTEEIFTTPDYRRTQGVVRSTRPLALEGTIVADLAMEFRDGVAVRVEAGTGVEIVKGQHDVDPGAARLGEVALVDGASPIGQTGVTYLDTLLDENATSHIAYGAGYPTCIPAAADAPETEWESHAVNPSRVHTDFMVGGPEVDVYGVTAAGERVPVIANNAWQLG